jgi:hypothetical protein
MISYPKHFIPNDTETFLCGVEPIRVPKCNVTFDSWYGTALKNTFGGKPLLDVGGIPMFAELTILSHFINDGWQARWIEPYARPAQSPMFLTAWQDKKFNEQTHVPIPEEKIVVMLSEIALGNNNSYSGCWDVLAWKGESIVFAESKRKGKDKIRGTQCNWLNAALNYGLAPVNFLVVNWDDNRRTSM